MKKITVTKVVFCTRELFFDIISSPSAPKLSDFTKESSNVYRSVGIMLPVRDDYYRFQIKCPEVSNRIRLGVRIV